MGVSPQRTLRIVLKPLVFIFQRLDELIQTCNELEANIKKTKYKISKLCKQF